MSVMRHALPGILIVLLTMFIWWSPFVFLILICCTIPIAVHRRRAAELKAAKELYFGQWADRIDPIWLPADVKAYLARRPWQLIPWKRKHDSSPRYLDRPADGRKAGEAVPRLGKKASTMD